MRNSSPVEKYYSDPQSSIDGSLTSAEAFLKQKLKQPPATGQENYQYLTSLWQQENMRTFNDFLRQYNNKNVLPTLETMQKVVVFFYRNRGTDKLKLSCSLPKFANICFHKSTTARFYPFTENDKDFVEELCEYLVGGPP